MEYYDESDSENPFLQMTEPGQGQALLEDCVATIQGFGIDPSSISHEALEFARITGAPGLGQAYVNIGTRLIRDGRPIEALRCFENALQIDSSEATTWISRGLAYRILGRLAEALHDIDYGLELAPGLPFGLYHRGMIYQDLGDDAAAFDDFYLAIEGSPDVAEAHYKRGLIYDRYLLYDEAITDFDRVIELAPEMAQAYAARGRVYRNLGEYDRSMLDINQAIMLDPDFDQYKTMLKDAQVLAALTLEISTNPNQPKAYMARAVYLSLVGDGQAALRDVEQAASLGEPQAEELMAEIWQKLFWDSVDALQRAGSPGTVELVLQRFPFINHPDFLKLLAAAVDKVEPENRLSYEEHLSWLRQILDETSLQTDRFSVT